MCAVTPGPSPRVVAWNLPSLQTTGAHSNHVQCGGLAGSCPTAVCSTAPSSCCYGLRNLFSRGVALGSASCVGKPDGQPPMQGPEPQQSVHGASSWTSDVWRCRRPPGSSWWWCVLWPGKNRYMGPSNVAVGIFEGWMVGGGGEGSGDRGSEVKADTLDLYPCLKRHTRVCTVRPRLCRAPLRLQNAHLGWRLHSPSIRPRDHQHGSPRVRHHWSQRAVPSP
jgi:hypothetical protein